MSQHINPTPKQTDIDSLNSNITNLYKSGNFRISTGQMVYWAKFGKIVVLWTPLDANNVPAGATTCALPSELKARNVITYGSFGNVDADISKLRVYVVKGDLAFYNAGAAITSARNFGWTVVYDALNY